ncbi:TldD/PmbA family protein, partial [bacterium]|nr:TldD/PmbA family protein [bacterium]
MEHLLKKVISQLSIRPNEWVGIRWHSENSRVREIRDGHPEENNSSRSTGVMIEWLVDGQFGYAATPRLSEKSLVEAALSARAQAQAAAKHALFRFDTSRRPPSSGHYSTKVKTALSQLSEANHFELLMGLNRRMKTSDAILSATASLQLVNLETCYVSSNGAHFEQDLSLVTVSMNATGQKNGIVQKRSNHGLSAYSYQGGAELLYLQLLNAQADKVAVQLHELLDAR